MSNYVKIKRSNTPGVVPTSLVDGEIAINQADKKLFYRDDAGVVQTFNLKGSSSSISGTANFDFGIEDDTLVVTVLNTNLTNANFKAFSFIPKETSTTFLDDFSLNGLSFNIENIINNVSFDIRAKAQNNASGIYQIEYKLQY